MFVFWTLGLTALAAVQLYVVVFDTSLLSIIVRGIAVALLLGLAGYNMLVRLEPSRTTRARTGTKRATDWSARMGVAAVWLLVVVSVLSAIDRPSDEPSRAVQGREAARRIGTVLATNALDPPHGLVRQIMFKCDRDSGEPGLVFAYGGPTAGKAVVAQLRNAKWDRFQPGDEHSAEYQKFFKDWVASLGSLGPSHGRFFSATLLVGSDLTVDCSSYQKDVAKVLQRHQASSRI